MKFTKMHGAGNDYVYVNAFREKVRNAPAVSRAISDRHTGIGSDGLILIAPSRKANFRMIMYNADGSESEMCGNGIRCIGKYVYDHGLTRRREISVETPGGVVDLQLHSTNGKVNSVTVDMGAPRKAITKKSLRAVDRTFPGCVVSVGNPHFVTLVRNVRKFPIEKYGPVLEHHRFFPRRSNIEFVEILSKGRVRQRTWERGSGETLACGSGACAVAASLYKEGFTNRRVKVELLGGTLEMEIGQDDHILMTGPAVEVFSGTWPTKASRKR